MYRFLSPGLIVLVPQDLNSVDCVGCSRLLRYWQTRTHCCGNIVAHDVSLRAQTGKHLLRTQNVLNKIRNIFVSRTQTLCPQQMLRARANGETFVSATMCPQQCVLVCQYLYSRFISAGKPINFDRFNYLLDRCVKG